MGRIFCPCCFFHVFFFFVSTGPAASMRAPCLIYLSTRTGVRTGAIFFLSVCLFVTFVVLLSARAVRGGFPQVRDLQKRVSIANAWDGFRRTPSRGGWCRVALWFGVFLGCGGFFFVLFLFLFYFIFFFERTRSSASMRTPCLIYLCTNNVVSRCLPIKKKKIILR